MSRTQRRAGTKSYRRIKIQEGESRHHRKPRSRGGSNQSWNISVVSQKHHDAWHEMFSNLDPFQICEQINRRWLDSDYEFICRRKEAACTSQKT
jgi:hypothetical protein